MKQKLFLKTKTIQTSVSSKVAFIIIVLVGLIGIGFVGINLLPAATGADDSKPAPEPLGVCRHGLSFLGEPSETKNITQSSCAKKLYTHPITGEKIPMPLLWCPGNNDCNCNREDAYRYEKLNDILGKKDFYNDMFNSFYYPDLSSNDQMLMLVWLMEWHAATSLNCECGLQTTLYNKISEFDDKDGNKINLMEYKTEGTRSDRCVKGICATPGFMRDVIKMINRVTIFNATLSTCDGLPAGCQMTDGFAVSGHSAGSDHYTGSALDFSCGESLSTTGCQTKTQKLLSKIRGEGFSVIRECTPDEASDKILPPPAGQCPGEKSTTQIIHIDTKSRGVSGEPCVFQDCIWSCAP